MAFADQDTPFTGGRFAGILIGYGVFHFLGASTFIPAIGSLLAFLLIKKLRPTLADFALCSVSFMVGHAAWIAVGAIVEPQFLGAVLFDIVVSVLLAIWLLFRISRAALYGLIAFELLGLLSNAYTMSLLDGWNAQRAALTVHIILRVAVIGFGLAALHKGLLRREVTDQESVEVFS